MKAISSLREGFGMRLNWGDSSLWHTDWLGTGPICNLLNFVHISDTQIRLRDVWEDGVWRLDKLVRMIPDNVKHAITSMTVPPRPNDNVPDCWAWIGTNDGIYKASAGYRWLLGKQKLGFQQCLEVDLESQSSCKSPTPPMAYIP